MAPALTADRTQPLEALEIANRTRIAASRLKRDVANGRVTFATAVDHSDAGCIDVLDLVMAQRRWGRKRSMHLLRVLAISETRKVRDLTARQRGLLVEHAHRLATPATTTDQGDH